ncbi:MAG: hypothetical protein LBJ71_01900 [Holosporaceae bacterium]|jgi:hypothetical protein|nr:hypothetical protein [Holosporaceae bacterium]
MNTINTMNILKTAAVSLFVLSSVSSAYCEGMTYENFFNSYQPLVRTINNSRVTMRNIRNLLIHHGVSDQTEIQRLMGRAFTALQNEYSILNITFRNDGGRHRSKDQVSSNLSTRLSNCLYLHNLLMRATESLLDPYSRQGALSNLENCVNLLEYEWQAAANRGIEQWQEQQQEQELTQQLMDTERVQTQTFWGTIRNFFGNCWNSITGFFRWIAS